MNKANIYLVLVLLLFSNNIQVDKLLNELNIARSNPVLYGSKLGLNLSYINKTNPLILDEELSIDCYNWAIQMANSNNIEHDPDNEDYAESVGCTTNPDNLIAMFIIDKDNPDFGHRHHLLDYKYKTTKVGIGVIKKNNLYWICIRTN